MHKPEIHRVVTGHDENGKAIVSIDGGLSAVTEISTLPGVFFHEVWNTQGSPAVIDNGPDPTSTDIQIPPPKQGSRIRFVDIPPESRESLQHGAGHMRDAFEEMGDAAMSTMDDHAPHPMMHRTETVDYGIVVDGEINLVLDDCEVPLKAGSVVVQRGTNHSWANRSDRYCRMLFILIDGIYEPNIANALAQR